MAQKTVRICSSASVEAYVDVARPVHVAPLEIEITPKMVKAGVAVMNQWASTPTDIDRPFLADAPALCSRIFAEMLKSMPRRRAGAAKQ